MSKLSVIIPYCNEYPQVNFTIRAIAEELKGLNFEIIAIDNYCKQAHDQQVEHLIRDRNSEEITKVIGGRTPDQGGETICGSQRAAGFDLKYIKYDEKLSHWNAKNAGIKIATGDIFYFVDAHVLPSKGDLADMYIHYRDAHEDLKGTISMPLTYKILDSKRQIYKLFLDEDGSVHYKFTPIKSNNEVIFEVPCMSCCGVMVSREILEKLGGGWPSLYGIYGGGENFFNFTLRTLGIKSYIYNGECFNATLYHHGERRGYHYEYVDFSRNRGIAAYIIGGKKYLELYLARRKLDHETKRVLHMQILAGCSSLRDDIKSRQKISIIDWLTMAFDKGWIEGHEAIDRFSFLKNNL